MPTETTQDEYRQGLLNREACAKERYDSARLGLLGIESSVDDPFARGE